MKEQCLGKIELIYSNILKEVDKTLTDTNDYDSFKEYIVSDNFLNTIKNIQDDDLNNTTYQINRTDLNDKNNIYYEIISKTTYNKFSKQIVAYVKKLKIHFKKIHQVRIKIIAKMLKIQRRGFK